MADVFIGLAAIGVVCVLVLVLALQVQVRTLNEKVDQVLQKLGQK